MGYSFSAPCKSKKARDEMFAFVQEHYRAWDKIVEPLKDELEECGKDFLFLFVGFETGLRGPLIDGLSYDRSKYKIGFDYGAGLSDGERYWMYNFCYWVAQRVGRRRTFSKQAPDCGAVPYVLYDGLDAWPVLEKSEYGEKVGDSEWLVENGFRGMVSLCERERKEKLHKERGIEDSLAGLFAARRKVSEIVDRALKTELSRLTLLWDER